VTDRLDADFPEIVDRQARQDLEVDAVVPERLLVGLQAEAAQPFSDVHFTSRRFPPLPFESASC